MRFCLSAVAALAVAMVLDDPANAQSTNGEPVVGNKVLHHAVFFNFKDSATEADVEGVVEAFAELQHSVPSIIAFEHGINNSPEGLDDGFTHCFVVTFADQEGLESYLPHPGHLGLVQQATPHMEDLFVIDFFGTDAKSDKRQLRHAVFFKFKDDASADEVANVVKAFEALPAKIDAIKGFQWGTKLKPGQYDGGFTHCFLLTFDSEAGRAAYLPHPDHQAFGNLLRPILDKVRVLDYWTGK